jgi:hypothetical protein
MNDQSDLTRKDRWEECKEKLKEDEPAARRQANIQFALKTQKNHFPFVNG